MKPILKIIFVVILLIISGICFFFSNNYLKDATPYLENRIHTNRISNMTFFSEEIQSYISFKLETVDTFVANNLIRISIATGTTINIKSIQLTFEGAQQYFIGDYNFSDIKSIDKFNDDVEKNIIRLERKAHPVTNISTFSAYNKNLTYNQGGKFDIGITITKENGEVIGYELGNRNYVLNDVMQISPPEILISIKNNNLILGLTNIGLGLALLGIGSSILFILLNHFLTQQSNEQYFGM